MWALMCPRDMAKWGNGIAASSSVPWLPLSITSTEGPAALLMPPLLQVHLRRAAGDGHQAVVRVNTLQRCQQNCLGLSDDRRCRFSARKWASAIDIWRQLVACVGRKVQ